MDHPRDEQAVFDAVHDLDGVVGVGRSPTELDDTLIVYVDDASAIKAVEVYLKENGIHHVKVGQIYRHN